MSSPPPPPSTPPPPPHPPMVQVVVAQEQQQSSGQQKQGLTLSERLAARREAEAPDHVNIGPPRADWLPCGLYSWGSGSWGRLGLGDETMQSHTYLQPIRLPPSFGGVRFTHVCAGSGHTFAWNATTCSGVWSWGKNHRGQLGHGNLLDYYIPTPIEAMHDRRISTLATGDTHTLVNVHDTNEVYVWGCGYYGCLGLGDEENVLSPTPLPGFGGDGDVTHNNIVALATGQLHSLIATFDGETRRVYGFGSRRSAVLGGGVDQGQELVPVEIEALRGIHVTQLGAGDHHSMALEEGGRVWYWGRLRVDGRIASEPKPHWLDVVQEEVAQICAKKTQSHMITTTGRLYAFSYGDGCDAITAPIHIQAWSNDLHVRQVCAQMQHCVCLLSDGSLRSWGTNPITSLAHREYNDCGQCGNGYIGMHPTLPESSGHPCIVGLDCCRTVPDVPQPLIDHVTCGTNHGVALVRGPST